MVVLGDQRGGRVAGDRIEVVARRFACGRASRRFASRIRAASVLQVEPARPAGVPGLRRASRSRRASPRSAPPPRSGSGRAHPSVPDTTVYPRRSTTSGEGERCLVHADAAGDRVARDRERTLGRELRIEGADDPVLEDHPRNLLTGDQQQRHACCGEQHRRDDEREHAGGNCHDPDIGSAASRLEPLERPRSADRRAA